MKKSTFKFLVCFGFIASTLAGCANTDPSQPSSEPSSSEEPSPSEPSSETSSPSSSSEEIYYTVRFDTKGGTPIQDVRVKKGDRISRPEDPVIDYGEFKTWMFDDIVNKEQYEWMFSQHCVFEDITLTAEYDMAVPSISIGYTCDLDSPYYETDYKIAEFINTPINHKYFKQYNYLKLRYFYELKNSAWTIHNTINMDSINMPNFVISPAFVKEGKKTIYNKPIAGSAECDYITSCFSPLAAETKNIVTDAAHKNVFEQLVIENNYYFMPIGESKGTYYSETGMTYEGSWYFFISILNPYRFEYHVDDYDIERHDVCQQLLESIYDFFN